VNFRILLAGYCGCPNRARVKKQQNQITLANAQAHTLTNRPAYAQEIGQAVVNVTKRFYLIKHKKALA
jgi:hypothetical protein